MGIFFSCWIASFISFWHYFDRKLSEVLTTRNSTIFWLGSALMFAVTYKIIRPWKEDDDKLDDDINCIGEN